MEKQIKNPETVEEKILVKLGQQILTPEEISADLNINFLEAIQVLSKLEIEERIEETPSGYKII